MFECDTLIFYKLKESNNEANAKVRIMDCFDWLGTVGFQTICTSGWAGWAPFINPPHVHHYPRPPLYRLDREERRGTVEGRDKYVQLQTSCGIMSTPVLHITLVPFSGRGSPWLCTRNKA